MTRDDLIGDVVLMGDQVGAFCDLVDSLGEKQAFDVSRLRHASRIVRAPSLGQTEFRVTYEKRGTTVVLPVKGL